MRKIYFKILSITAVILFSASGLLSQVPEGFSYQAVARTASGEEITDANLLVRIAILSSVSPDVVLWEEEHSVTTNSFGLFSITVGSSSVKTDGSLASFNDIDWSTGEFFIRPSIKEDAGAWQILAASQIQSVPFAMATKSHTGGKLEIVSLDDNSTEALFEVKRKDGQPVFSVFPDRVEMHVDDVAKKGSRGGFSVGGFDRSKGSQEYLFVSPDSIRMYIPNTDDAGKGLGSRGGFAVGGFDPIAKGMKDLYFNVTGTNTADVYNNVSQVLWYPRKEAFFAGNIHIGDPDSVGFNSTAIGFRPVAMGDYSQAFGYASKAIANNTTAIGNRAQALGLDSYAFGSAAVAQGDKSFALGSVGVDSLNNPIGNPTIASGNYSMALGMSSQAIGQGSLSFGVMSQAIGYYSTSLGYQASAEGAFSNAFGLGSTAAGRYSMAFGYRSSAPADYSVAIGVYALTEGVYSVALGRSARSYQPYSYALGYNAAANNYSSYAIGQNATASNNYSVAIGRNSSTTGYASTAIGYYASAAQSYANAIGYYADARAQYSYAFGRSAYASGDYSTAIGYGARATSQNAYAIGRGSQATGAGSLATGYFNLATADSAIAIGSNNKSAGNNSVSLGNSNTAGSTSTSYAMALGNRNKSTGSYSIALGTNSNSTNSYSTAIGYYASATEDRATAIGYKSEANGYKALAVGANYYKSNIWKPVIPIIYFPLGKGSDDPEAPLEPKTDESKGLIIIPTTINQDNIASDSYSIAIGHGNTSSGGGAAFGVYNSSLAEYSTAIGFANASAGRGSIAAGYGSETNGDFSTAIGRYVTANAANSFVIGRYNSPSGNTTDWVEDDQLFVVGNGSGDSDRSNAMTMYKNGYTYFNGRDGYAGVYAYNRLYDRTTTSYGLRARVYTSTSTAYIYSGHFSGYSSAGNYQGLYADVRAGASKDVAEYIYDTNENTEAGDVVVADKANKESVVKSSVPYQKSVLGIISTKPHLTMGSELVIDEATGEPLKDAKAATRLTLTGRVPCKVTDENGSIEPGDMLTTSSIEGYAMKWSLLDVSEAKDFDELKKMMAENERRRNAVIGKAVEEHKSGTGKILVLVTL